MAILELIFLGLESKGISMDGNDPTEAKLLITELFRRVKVVLASLGKDLYTRSHCEVIRDISDNRKVI